MAKRNSGKKVAKSANTKAAAGKTAAQKQRQRAGPRAPKPTHVDIPKASADIDISDEDMQFFQHAGDHAAFLTSLSGKDISKRRELKVKQPRVRVMSPAEVNGAESDASDASLSAMDDSDGVSLSGSGSGADSLSEASMDASDLDDRAPKKKKPKTAVDDSMEREYERNVHVDASSRVKLKEKLPIKLPDGRVERRIVEVEESDESGDDEGDVLARPESVKVMVEQARQDELTMGDFNGMSAVEQAEKLASLAQMILEDPDKHIELLKSLRTATLAATSSKIKSIALLTQLAVYKDVIPGYRIRPLTEVEMKAKVSKDVKRLRQFEQVLMTNYQAYLQILETSLQQDKGKASVALRCLCQLLTTAPHFNFRTNIMTAIVTRMSRKPCENEEADLLQCCETVREFFAEDESGEGSLELTRLMSKMFKARSYSIHPQVLKSFWYLRLRDELHARTGTGNSRVEKEQPTVDLGNRKRKGKRGPVVSRAQKKVLAEERLIQKELRESEAIYSREEKQHMHSETLKLVFVVYFRVLKQASISQHENTPARRLLPIILEGLAKFSHLISIDFFDDLLGMLRQIMSSQDDEDLVAGDEVSGRPAVSMRDRLLCITTAFQLLTGQGEALNLDLREFYVHLYKIMPRFALCASVETAPETDSIEKAYEKKTSRRYATDAELLFRALDLLFFRLRQSPPAARAAAFVKRLAMVALYAPPSTARRCLETIQALIQKYPSIDALLVADDEDRAYGSGAYLPYVDDPELCNPMSAVLWELPLLRNHADSRVMAALKQLLKSLKQ